MMMNVEIQHTEVVNGVGTVVSTIVKTTDEAALEAALPDYAWVADSWPDRD
jgi:hypothetical protein